MHSEVPSKVKVGKIKDAHGLKGELYFFSFSRETEWFDDLSEVYLETINRNEDEPSFQKYELESYKIFKEGAIIKLKGISDRTMAEKLKGRNLFIPEQALVAKPGETIYLSEILNFKITNEQGQDLGLVVKFSSNTAQDILVIQKNNLIYEVPFVDHFILDICYEDKVIVMDFPESLMTVNSES